MIKLKDILNEVSDYYKKQIARRKKFQRAYGESKANGGKRVNELDLRKGQLGKENSMELLFDRHQKFPAALVWAKISGWARIYDPSGSSSIKSETGSQKIKPGDLVPDKYRKLIIRKFGGETILEDGEVVIIKNKKGSSRILYHLLDFSKPAGKLSRSNIGDYRDHYLFNCAEPNFYIGYILTSVLSEKNYKFSPKLQLNLSNIEQVHLSKIAVDYRGKGYGAKLYDAVAKQVDALYSDNILFEGSYAMWTNHIRKSSAFFGAVPLSSNTILPVDDVSKIKAADIEEFVSIFKKVPPKLIELKNFLKGINPDEVYAGDVVYQLRDKRVIKVETDDIVYEIDNNDTLQDFYKSFSDNQTLPTNTKAIVFTHSTATFVIKEVDGGLDFILI